MAICLANIRSPRQRRCGGVSTIRRVAMLVLTLARSMEWPWRIRWHTNWPMRATMAAEWHRRSVDCDKTPCGPMATAMLRWMRETSFAHASAMHVIMITMIIKRIQQNKIASTFTVSDKRAQFRRESALAANNMESLFLHQSKVSGMRLSCSSRMDIHEFGMMARCTGKNTTQSKAQLGAARCILLDAELASKPDRSMVSRWRIRRAMKLFVGVTTAKKNAELIVMTMDAMDARSVHSALQKRRYQKCYPKNGQNNKDSSEKHRLYLQYRPDHFKKIQQRISQYG